MGKIGGRERPQVVPRFSNSRKKFMKTVVPLGWEKEGKNEGVASDYRLFLGAHCRAP